VTAAAAEPVTAATTAEPTSTRFARASLVYRQSPSTKLGTVQGRHSFIRIGVYRHFDEGETTSLPCISVLHNLNPVDLAVCGKCRIQILLCGLERDVPDINILQGVLLR
jgi:hypothetical protein